MEIHNLLEDIVKSAVDEYCESTAMDQDHICACHQCKLDVICYVLNNMLPRYVVSSRGLIHNELDYSRKLQQEADIFHLIKKAFAIVGRRKRLGVSHEHKSEPDKKKGPYYNFPTIMGKVFNGTTFEPISDAEIMLFHNEELVDMAKETMSNPLELNEHTQGIFTFWPYSIKTSKAGKEKTFTFRINVVHPDYNEYTQLVETTVVSEENMQTSIGAQKLLTLNDIFLFPKGV